MIAKILLPASLAFLSGYVDTATFVHMHGLFVAHVTGNFVLLGTLIAGEGKEHGGPVLLQLMAFPVFFLAAGLAAIIGCRVRADSRRTYVLLWLIAILIGGVAISALLGFGHEGVLAMLLVVAMGLLNGTHRLDKELGAPFTVMTGNVTTLAVSAACHLGLAKSGCVSGPNSPSAPFIRLVSGFLVGSASGALIEPYLGLGAMSIPALFLIGFLFAPHRHQASDHSMH